MHGHDAEQVAAGGAQRVRVLPAGDRLRAQRCQPGDLRRQVVGLDVEVVARRAIDGLDDGEQTWDGAAQDGELLFARRGPSETPSAADQKSTAAPACAAGVSMRIPISRLRCMTTRLSAPLRNPHGAKGPAGMVAVLHHCGQLPTRFGSCWLIPGLARIAGRPVGRRQARWASVNVADFPFVVTGPLSTRVDPPQGGNRPRCRRDCRCAPIPAAAHCTPATRGARLGPAACRGRHDHARNSLSGSVRG